MCLQHATGTCVYSMQQGHVFTPCNSWGHATGTCVYSIQQGHVFTPCNRDMCLLYATVMVMYLQYLMLEHTKFIVDFQIFKLSLTLLAGII